MLRIQTVVGGNNVLNRRKCFDFFDDDLVFRILQLVAEQVSFLLNC